MMEVVIVDDGNRLTVYELVERVIPCIIAKHYSENYIQGFRSTFRNLLAYCNKNEKKYFTAELAQQFMLDCYGVQPGTVERRCSRVHRAMDLLSDYQHFNAVMLRRRLNREFPAGLQEGAVNYLQKLSLHGRRENTLRSHRNVLLRFTDYLFSVGVTDYKLLSADIVNRYVKVVSCNYSNSVVRLHYSILLRFFQYLAHSGYKETDLSLKMMPIVKVSASARIPTTLDLSQIESILTSVDRESPQGKRDYAVLMIAVKLGIRTSDLCQSYRGFQRYADLYRLGNEPDESAPCHARRFCAVPWHLAGSLCARGATCLLLGGRRCCSLRRFAGHAVRLHQRGLDELSRWAARPVCR